MVSLLLDATTHWARGHSARRRTCKVCEKTISNSDLTREQAGKSNSSVTPVKARPCQNQLGSISTECPEARSVHPKPEAVALPRWINSARSSQETRKKILGQRMWQNLYSIL
jgi:hypothetical protein